MKIYLVAVIISILLVVVFTAVNGIFQIASTGDPNFLSEGPLYTPLRLPRILYRSLAPDLIQDAAAMSPFGSVAERLVFFVANVFIYSIPIFVILRLLFKPKKAI